MKNVLILMLGLVIGTTSFAQTTEHITPVATVSITTDQKLKLVVDREDAVASVTLRDTQGHLLYSSNVNLREGFTQKFNIDELTAGSYQLAVAVGNDSFVKTFVVADQPAQKLIALRS
ncbi:hypothetical protein [Spirosoma pollinicola]|nr:hypothetical protein [Spirosoma pollinicola]